MTGPGLSFATPRSTNFRFLPKGKSHLRNFLALHELGLPDTKMSLTSSKAFSTPS